MGAAVSIGILEGVDKSWPWPWTDGNFASRAATHEQDKSTQRSSASSFHCFPRQTPLRQLQQTAGGLQTHAGPQAADYHQIEHWIRHLVNRQQVQRLPMSDFTAEKSLSSDIDTHRSPEVWGSSTWHVKINKQSSKSQALTCFPPFALPDFTVFGPIHVPP